MDLLIFRYSDRYEDADLIYQMLYRFILEKTGEPKQDLHAELHPEQQTLLASDETGRTIGGMVFYRLNGPKHIYINYFVLDETVRRKGYGRRIFEEFFSCAKKDGVEYLDVRSNAYMAPGFYLKMGFHVTGEEKEPHPLCPDNIHYSFRMYLQPGKQVESK